MIRLLLFLNIFCFCTPIFPNDKLPEYLAQGEVITIEYNKPVYLEPIWIKFNGKKHYLFEENNKYFSIIGIHFNAELRCHSLIVRSEYRILDIHRICILPGRFEDEVLSVKRKFVSFTPEIKKRIRSEWREVQEVYKQKPIKKLFHGSFKNPLKKIYITSKFATRRIYNNFVSGRHGGIDLRARTGVPIKAINNGVVALAAYHYLPGRRIILNHGIGVFSSYLHLSKILVGEGEYVKKGQIIGLAGASGRVTGPHLDLRIWIQGAVVNPLKFISLNLQ